MDIQNVTGEPVCLEINRWLPWMKLETMCSTLALGHCPRHLRHKEVPLG
jgi:hypothetical protein